MLFKAVLLITPKDVKSKTLSLCLPPSFPHPHIILTGEDEEGGEKREDKDLSPRHLERPRQQPYWTKQQHLTQLREEQEIREGREWEERDWDRKAQGGEGSYWNFNSPIDTKKKKASKRRSDVVM